MNRKDDKGFEGPELFDVDGREPKHPSLNVAFPAPSKEPTMTEYLKNDASDFSEKPFNPVDSLVLSSLSYLDFNAYRYADPCAGEPVPVVDIVRFTKFDDLLNNGWIAASKELPPFVEALLRCHRFADLSVMYFVQEDAMAIEKQFSACTFRLGGENPFYYLAFRGTDGTLAGWKEDFNLSYRKVIPSQRSAERYVSGVLSALPADARVMIGGHSKGGNLAEFAAATVDDVTYERIERVFNHDGPSFLNAPSPRMNEQHFKDKLFKTVPESSIFGMMLEHRDDFSVVKSDAPGIFQHNPFSWLTGENDFVYQESLNASAAFFDQTLDRWLKSCTPEQRETFIDTIYELIVSTDATNWQEFNGSWLPNVAGVLRDGKNLDHETKEIILHTIRNLGSVANATVRERIGRFIERMRNAARLTDARP